MFAKLVDQSKREIHVNVSQVAFVIRDDAMGVLRVVCSGGAHVEVPPSSDNVAALSQALGILI